ncbi:lipopolysaccharide biosynthesis protein [Streptomyces sp. URMC 123]|uniref:lipopolysaccharide biosynthesis protein n=1 Tax=Streptomyces sp. URMC 123 TaxID=3423403 RepID=UPI003F1B84FE
MTHATLAPQPHEEPDLLRDQFRQLLRYRVLIALGVAAGLLGGAWLGLTGADRYVATSEVTVRSATVDPFAPGGTSPDKQVSIGSERQTAVSNAVAARAAEALGAPEDAERLQRGLQVTNPPNTLVLRFAYTAHAPGVAAERANAFTRAYLDNRRQQTQSLIDNMVKGYEKQLAPLEKQRDDLADEMARLGAGKALDTRAAVQSSVIGKISDLNSSITKLKALDTTPGFVVRTATPPGAPTGPGLPLLLALGAAVGLGLGLLGAWVRLVFDPTARSAGDVVRALRAPVLGTLPRPRGRRPALGRLSGPGGPGGSASGGLLAEGRLAEEYRSVAFRLAYDQTFAARRRLLVVAPRGAIDPVAEVSVNLAASFVEMGMETLLIEADLRDPGLTDRLRTAAGAARPNWARGEQGWPTGARVPVDAGESGTFDLIPGARVRNVARALTSAPASQLIASADASDSVVVVLAPAVLSYADALALADRVDGVLVVCDPREVRRDDLDRVRELIDGAGGTVLGALLHSQGAGVRRRASAAAGPAVDQDGAASGARSGAAAGDGPGTPGGPAARARSGGDRAGRGGAASGAPAGDAAGGGSDAPGQGQSVTPGRDAVPPPAGAGSVPARGDGPGAPEGAADLARSGGHTGRIGRGRTASGAPAGADSVPSRGASPAPGTARPASGAPEEPAAPGPAPSGSSGGDRVARGSSDTASGRSRTGGEDAAAGQVGPAPGEAAETLGLRAARAARAGQGRSGGSTAAGRADRPNRR